MSVEHDGADGADRSGGVDGRPDPALDALLAVITDEPLPDGAHRDAAFMAAHRSAAADVAVLREQLAVIGGTLADSAPQPAPRPVQPTRNLTPAPRRRPFVLALRVAAAACAATVLAGLGWLVVQAPSGADDSGSSAAKDAAPDAVGDEDAKAGASRTAAGYLACARLVVEGTVTEVAPVPGTGKDRVTLRVSRSYKPEAGPAETVFTIDQAVDPRLREGQHVLVGIPRAAAEPDLWAVGEADVAHHRAWITEALPESRTTDCG